MNAFNNGVVRSGQRMETLSKRVDKVSAATKKLGNASKDINKLNNSLKDTNRSAFDAKSGVDSLTKSVKRMAAAFLGVMTIGTILDSADTITAATNKLSTVYQMENPNATDAQTKSAVQGQMDNIFASAQRSRSGYNATMQNVGKMLINAGDTFEGNIDKAIAFNELMSKSYTIGGASDTEQETSMYQLIQALGSGTLAGDELRSVREGAQVAYKYIEEYAQKLLESEESLKDLASKGLITSDIVTDAILSNADAINEMFDKTQVTFEQTWVMMKNNFMKAFEPVLQKFTTLLNNEEFQTMLVAITSAFVGLADVVLDGLERMGNNWSKLTDFMRNHASLISDVIIPLMIGLITAMAIYGAVSVAAAIAANWQLFLIIGTIALIVGAILWLLGEFEWVAQMLGGLIGYLIAVIWNLIVGIVNFIYGVVVAVYNFIANIVNAVVTAFSSATDNIWMMFVGLGKAVLDLILDVAQSVAEILDAVFGSEWSSAIQSFQNNINDQLAREGYEETIVIEPITDTTLLDRVDEYEWGRAGIEIGGSIHEKLSGVEEWLNKSLDTGESPFSGNDWETTFKNALDGSDLGGNVGDIADAVELTAEDLLFLRELAEMETINRFTTAEIKVDMSNYNTINGENDLDGLVIKLSEKLEEEMHIVAEGNY